MTPKESRFCQHYAAELNGAKAAVLAGFSPRSARQIAHRMLTKDYIRERINELIAEEDEELVARASEVLRCLTATMRDQNARPADRLKAAELLGKIRGLFSEKTELTVTQVEHKPRVVVYLPKIEEDPEDEDDIITY